MQHTFMLSKPYYPAMGGPLRNIIVTEAGFPPVVFLPVADDINAVDILEAVRRAYELGKEGAALMDQDEAGKLLPSSLEPVPPPQPESPAVARLHQQALADLAALPEDHDNEISEDLSTRLGCARLLWQVTDRVYGGASPGELISASLDVATALADEDQ